MSFSKLANILSQVRAKYPALSKRLQEAEAVSRWEEAVGPQISKHTRAIRVQDAVLWVEVDHPVWKSELHYRKRQILDQINRSKPHEAPAITDILFLDKR
jgi:predicted nucleic acid-binding Zn ribbon protein